jgi:hypothetical protein
MMQSLHDFQTEGVMELLAAIIHRRREIGVIF